ncbi:UvrD-helicase domain-containing protein [Legionella pneumophila]|uniref:UvrD-helicase domain-containing protein n=2 Tax=Legionella pneumophila TaxID=446 RepID=UPI001C1C038F|nr:UvrD-helicase domain-containing protein [Legionella pneumophila]HBD9273251.1 UvrD-helicase domain-containing protein [Legionella pneumophila]HBD9315074.1 UvrD-helicase domain-containing protein [Legionella pneumophila]HBD9424266.1 UvrD-helicase domain-containing protein [Legionella pneumophila]HCJ1145452.1 UvrD-helicase domain-containing protein [Legionella pneumophila]
MMNKDNKLIVAAAGSGKTTFLVNEALQNKDSNILITTYTQANEEEIRNKFIKINKCIPKNVTIQTWFSFLIQHGVKPYQGGMGLSDFECKGLLMVNGQSARYVNEKKIVQHYFSNGQKIYSDKLAKFVVNSNANSSGDVINRLARIYDRIFIDESQDLAGYDLEVVRLLLESNAGILLVGDPRQCTYITNYSSKNKKYRWDNFINFFEDNQVNLIKDDSSFTVNYRCHKKICDLSNKIYPDYGITSSGNFKTTGHDGIFLVQKSKVEKYLSKYHPVQLRWDTKAKISTCHPVYNFGLSKGLEFNRVLIYPPKPFISWLKKEGELKPVSKAKLYVAVTRARYSVGIVWHDDDVVLNDISNWDD